MVQNKKKISLWFVLMGAFMSAYGGIKGTTVIRLMGS